MSSDRSRLVLAAGIALFLAGCATPGGPGSMGHSSFGEASRQTFAAQVVNPSPEYDEPYAEGNGAKVAAAVERYRTDKVKRPTGQSVTGLGQTSSKPATGN
jgi:hypothetical protein